MSLGPRGARFRGARRLLGGIRMHPPWSSGGPRQQTTVGRAGRQLHHRPRKTGCRSGRLQVFALGALPVGCHMHAAAAGNAACCCSTQWVAGRCAAALHHALHQLISAPPACTPSPQQQPATTCTFPQWQLPFWGRPEATRGLRPSTSTYEESMWGAASPVTVYSSLPLPPVISTRLICPCRTAVRCQ